METTFIASGAYRLLFRVFASHPDEVRSFYDDTVAPIVKYDDQYATDLLAFRPRLMGDQVHPQHLPGDFTCFIGTLRQFHSPTFAPTSCVNLCFNDNIDIPKLTRDLFRFVERRSDFASRRRHIESLQQFLGLIFVNVHLAELPGRSAISQTFRRYTSNR